MSAGNINIETQVCTCYSMEERKYARLKEKYARLKVPTYKIRFHEITRSEVRGEKKTKSRRDDLRW